MLIERFEEIIHPGACRRLKLTWMGSRIGLHNVKFHHISEVHDI
jgi:hypothetical protein